VPAAANKLNREWRGSQHDARSSTTTIKPVRPVAPDYNKMQKLIKQCELLQMTSK
jgi:hypothetical protein